MEEVEILRSCGISTRSVPNPHHRARRGNPHSIREEPKTEANDSGPEASMAGAGVDEQLSLVSWANVVLLRDRQFVTDWL